MTRAKIFNILLICSLYSISFEAKADAQYDALKYSRDDLPITVDNRIKTYVYNSNEVYSLIVHFGFQSHIEFAEGEEIIAISIGDAYAWKLTPMKNRLFIKTMEENIRTNMTIVTNKRRTYNFDLETKNSNDENYENIVYLVRFLYPKKK